MKHFIIEEIISNKAKIISAKKIGEKHVNHVGRSLEKHQRKFSMLPSVTIMLIVWAFYRDSTGYVVSDGC